MLSKSALVAPSFNASVKPCVISPAFGPSVWKPTTSSYTHTQPENMQRRTHNAVQCAHACVHNELARVVEH